MCIRKDIKEYTKKVEYFGLESFKKKYPILYKKFMENDKKISIDGVVYSYKEYSIGYQTFVTILSSNNKKEEKLESVGNPIRGIRTNVTIYDYPTFPSNYEFPLDFNRKSAQIDTSKMKKEQE